MSTIAVGPPRKVFFPDDFAPTADHVICGRGKKSYGHVGNQQFLQVVASRINEYAKADTKQAKSEIVQAIVLEIDDKGGFIRQDDASGKYYRAEDGAGREKTSQALRDCLKHKYKSSKDIKKTNRKAKRLARQHSKERVGRRGSMGSQGTYGSTTNHSTASYTPVNVTSMGGGPGGGPPVTVLASPVQLKGFDPGALGKSRRHRRNSIGATAPPSWDTSQYEPTPMMTTAGGVGVGLRRGSGGFVSNHPGMPSPSPTNHGQQQAAVTAAMGYGPPNTFSSPACGARSARGLSRRASASSYFDTNLNGPANFGVPADRTMDVSQLSNTPDGLGYNVDKNSARGYNNNNVDLGYGQEELGYNTTVEVKLPAAGDFYNRRRTSASSNASSYWSGYDSHSTTSNYWNNSKGNESGGWVDGAAHEDDDSWAEGLDLNLLADLTDDLDALRVVQPGMDVLGPTPINPAAEANAAMPDHHGRKLSVEEIMVPGGGDLQQQQQQQQMLNMQQQMQDQQNQLTAENLATVYPSGQTNLEHQVSTSTGSHAESNYWQGEGDPQDDDSYRGRSGSVSQSQGYQQQRHQEPILSASFPSNNNNQSNAMGFYPVDGQQLQQQQMMLMQQQMEEHQMKLRQMQQQMEKQMHQMQQQQAQGQNNQQIQSAIGPQIFD